MIPYFPSPLPDELLYSVIARYSDRVQYRDKQFLNRELFGDKNITAIVDLPCHLRQLVAILPTGYGYTVERLIDEHTLLPFYSPFLPSERVNLIREHMRSMGGGAIHKWSGIVASSIHRPSWLRFCPLCVQEDNLKFGEPYWHRLHQLTGVEVCPVHQVFLESSQAPARNHSNCSEYFSASQTIKLETLRLLDLSHPHHRALHKIAVDAAWLLEQANLVPGFECLRNRYLRILAEQNLGLYTGVVHVNKLVKQFQEYYSSDLLSLLQCEVNQDKRSNWLSQLVKSLNRDKVNHPLRHLLLMQFLGYTCAQFHQLPNHLNLFGSGPWPCLNRICSDFRKLSISDCLVKYHRDHGGNLIATFRCHCGFTYARVGPDALPEDQWRIDIIRAYGTVWEDALCLLWSNETVSLKEIARRLGVGSANTIKRQAILLNLPFPRPGPHGQLTALSQEQYHSVRASENMLAAKIDSYRRQWLAAIAEYPLAKRTFLSHQFSQAYAYLRKHDAEWLEAHLPPPDVYRRVGSARVVDWSSRDIELAEAVRLSANRIRSSLELVRVTKGSISRDLDRRMMLNGYLHKLPLTTLALAEVVETYELFAIRRLEWAAKCFHEENIHPTRWQLVNRASISSQILADSQVQAAIDRLLLALTP